LEQVIKIDILSRFFCHTLSYATTASCHIISSTSLVVIPALVTTQMDQILEPPCNKAGDSNSITATVLEQIIQSTAASLVAFPKLQKVTYHIHVCLSVYPTAWSNSGANGRIFCDI
jgi:hypothetical protein